MRRLVQNESLKIALRMRTWIMAATVVAGDIVASEFAGGTIKALLRKYAGAGVKRLRLQLGQIHPVRQHESDAIHHRRTDHRRHDDGFFDHDDGRLFCRLASRLMVGFCKTRRICVGA